MSDDLLSRALIVKRESRAIEFKISFEQTPQCWCEIVKDVVAIANSGGGIIVFGLDSNGLPAKTGMSATELPDPAIVIDHVAKYTGNHLPDIEVHEATKAGIPLIAWTIGAVEVPLVFAKPGTYAIDGGKQRTAFGQGTVYFRHGAKSEPGNTEDIAKAVQRRVDALRTEWLSGVRKVVSAPIGSQLVVLPPEIRESAATDAMPIRITDDPSAPAYRRVDPDVTHPYRRKELLRELGRRLPQSARFNGYDIDAIRYVYDTDKNPMFVHLPKYGTRQYSAQFLDWIVSEATRDEAFFQKTRAGTQIQS